jgi:hypothetical protein
LHWHAWLLLLLLLLLLHLGPNALVRLLLKERKLTWEGQVGSSMQAALALLAALEFDAAAAAAAAAATAATVDTRLQL